MKLMLFLSHNGILSRRKAFEAIKAGAVAVNGRVNLEPSTDVDSSRDKVAFHDRLVNDRVFEYIILNKPEGYVTTCAKQFDQRTVMDLLPKELKHLRPVGRLDKDTEGLIFFTNDGELANRMAHPSFDVDKTYLARVRWKLSEDSVRRLEEGVVIDGEKTSRSKVEVIKVDDKESQFYITIHEGRKHQVRLMADAVGNPVVALKRLRQGPLVLGHLSSGDWRRLTEEEARFLRSIKRAPQRAAKGADRKDMKPKVDEKKYLGRRGRGEFNRDQRDLKKTREQELERRAPRPEARSSSRPGSGSRSGPRPPRPEYSSKDGHRSSKPAIKPLFSSHSEKRRFSSTREWHSDTDVHKPRQP